MLASRQPPWALLRGRCPWRVQRWETCAPFTDWRLGVPGPLPTTTAWPPVHWDLAGHQAPLPHQDSVAPEDGLLPLLRIPPGQVVGGRVSLKPPPLPGGEPRAPHPLPRVTAGTPGTPPQAPPPFPPCPAHRGLGVGGPSPQGGQACLSKLQRGVGGRAGLRQAPEWCLLDCRPGRSHLAPSGRQRPFRLGTAGERGCGPW